MIINKFPKGQSMLEMVFSLGLLLISVIMILSLTISNISGQKESENQVIANNLAREGIEAIRNMRDSNWLANRNWDYGLDSGRYIVQFRPGVNTWQLVVLASPTTDEIYQLGSGVYCHNTGGTKTIYRRYIDLQSICIDASNSSAKGQEYIKATCISGSEQKIGIKINSTVIWTDRGSKSHQLIYEDLIYDWK